MHLRNPGRIDEAIEAVTWCMRECNNLHGRSSDARKAKEVYVAWVDQAYATLGSHFADGGLAEGMFSERYWQIVQLGDYSVLMFELVRREMQVQIGRLTKTIERLQAFKVFAGREGHIVVPDTSAFIQGVYFTDFDWSGGLGLSGRIRIIVPIVVVEEIDKLKSFDRGRNRDRARSVSKRLREVMRTVPAGDAAALRSGVSIEVFIDDEWHQRRTNNDGEIIEQALTLRDLMDREILLVCVDAAMEFRAREHGLKVAAMPEPDDATSTP
jgi:rRNA-processing protein FCF1